VKVAHLYHKLAHQPASKNPAIYHGGAQKVACQIALSMREYTEKVFFFSEDDDTTAIVQMFNQEGILHRQLKFRSNPFKWLSVIINMRAMVRHEQIDVLHCHSRLTLFSAYIVSILTRTKLIYTVHSVYHDKWLTRFFFGRNIIAISLQVKNNLIDYFLIKKNRISLIYNGVSTPKVSQNEISAINTLYELEPNIPVVVLVGKLVKAKGFDYFINGVPDVLKEHPSLKVLILGEGCFRSSLELLVKNLNLNSSVIFCGNQVDPRPFMQRAVCLCSPSLQEGFGCAILEAMFLETPVIATNVGVAPEVILNGENGILIPTQNSQAISKALLQILHNPTNSKNMAKQARQSVEKKFTLKQMLLEYKDYYDKLN